MTLQAEERGETAVATISARNDLLPIEAIAALTGNSISSDTTSDAYIALKEAHEAAAKMRGTIGYAQAFGISHIVVEFDVAPADVGIQQPKQDSGNGSNATGTTNGSGRPLLSYTSAVDLRPDSTPRTKIQVAQPQPRVSAEDQEQTEVGGSFYGTITILRKREGVAL